MRSRARQLSRLSALRPVLILLGSLTSVSAQSMPPNGSFGFLVLDSVSNPFTNGGTEGGSAALGVINFDGAGNASGSYTLQIGSGGAQMAQSIAGSLTGTYSTNPDGTGSLAITLDAGITITFGFVIGDSGNSLQMLATSCGGGCNIAGDVISGFAKATSPGPLNGSYAALLNNHPNPVGIIGVFNFDGAGNVSGSSTAVGAGKDPNNPPTQSGTISGTYSTNPDGSGTITLAGQNTQTYAFVIVDGGSGMLVVQTNRSGDGVQSGTARLQ